MKANELMIGDIVKVDDVICEAYIIFEDEVELLHNGTEITDKDGCTIPIDRVEPTPLTPEILEKNGFEQTGDSTFSISDDGMRFNATWWRESLFYVGFYRRDNNSPNEHFSLNVRYVHELQHILRLCGMNELADNLKI